MFGDVRLAFFQVHALVFAVAPRIRTAARPGAPRFAQAACMWEAGEVVMVLGSRGSLAARHGVGVGAYSGVRPRFGSSE